eukprot:CAMPEP_0198291292 /NCGR_PEP_ID=MMETSP1449-20131203/8867_1 /TAXON_ID=420275 /ORGANISM="Attheya septentrionalis, Strain CCMP2084" /LENGTH=256 /DNA_ID=CAMNT_0043989909 /DNA_START=236 /DNA_END=1006 /DNA_ORIENTATION=+
MNRRPFQKVFHISTRTGIRQERHSSMSLQEAASSSSSSIENVEDLKCNEVMRFRGAVAEGYGRGGKKLGFPTANLPASLFSTALTQVPTGVYFGWATIETAAKQVEGPYKAVVNVGYSPTFDGAENKEKIIEAHLITKSMPPSSSNDNEGEETEPAIVAIPDFYHQPMRLLLGGYLRPEQKFPSFPDLIAAIHNDVDTANMALDQEPFSKLRDDSFLTTDDGNSDNHNNNWVGSSGGDANASWEFQPFSDAWSNLE